MSDKNDSKTDVRVVLDIFNQYWESAQNSIAKIPGTVQSVAERAKEEIEGIYLAFVHYAQVVEQYATEQVNKISAKLPEVSDHADKTKKDMDNMLPALTQKISDANSRQDGVDARVTDANSKAAEIQQQISDGDLMTQEDGRNVYLASQGFASMPFPMQSDFANKVAGSLVECPHVLEADVQASGPRNYLAETKRKITLTGRGITNQSGMAKYLTQNKTFSDYGLVGKQMYYRYIWSASGTNISGRIGMRIGGSYTLLPDYIQISDSNAYGVVSGKVGIGTSAGVGQGLSYRFDDVPETVTITFTELQLSLEPFDGHCPAPEDLGIIPGQPNLFSYSTAKLNTTIMTSTGTEQTSNGRFTSDYIDVRGWVGFENNNLISSVMLCGSDKQAVCKWSSGSKAWVDMSGTSGNIQANSYTAFPTDRTFTYMKFAYAISATDAITRQDVIDYQLKIIRSSGTGAMDDYSPSQTDSGMTVINEGRSELPQVMYDAAKVAGDGQTVKLTQPIVGKFAELETRPFNVLAEVEQRMPWMLTGCNTVAEKVARLKECITSWRFESVARGTTYDSSGKLVNRARVYLLPNNSSVWWGSSTADMNATDKLASTVYQSTESSLGYLIKSDGTAVFKVSSQGQSNDQGSQGPDKPATLEIDHISLTVTFEVNGIVQDLVMEIKQLKQQTNDQQDEIEAIKAHIGL